MSEQVSKQKRPWLSLEHDVWEVNEQGNEIIRVNIGAATVQVDKLYGPLAAETVQIRLDRSTAEWIVERQRVDDDETWEEKARWDCQESWPPEEDE